jgi:hypothetical protein
VGELPLPELATVTSWYVSRMAIQGNVEAITFTRVCEELRNEQCCGTTSSQKLFYSGQSFGMQETGRVVGATQAAAYYLDLIRFQVFLSIVKSFVVGR